MWFSSYHFDLFRPLGEPKELKIKFDAIFQASRYVKAIENMNKLRKEYVWISSNGNICLFLVEQCEGDYGKVEISATESWETNWC